MSRSARRDACRFPAALSFALFLVGGVLAFLGGATAPGFDMALFSGGGPARGEALKSELAGRWPVSELNGKLNVTLTMENWTAFQTVRDTLEAAWEASAGSNLNLMDYLPSEVNVYVDRALQRMGIDDPAAVGGHVAFCTYNPKYTVIMGAYCVEISVLDGSLNNVVAAPQLPGMNSSCVHFDAFKPLGPGKYIVIGNFDDLGMGFQFKWEEGQLTPYQTGGQLNSHDVHLDPVRPDRLWSPSNNGTYALASVRWDTGLPVENYLFDGLRGLDTVEGFCEDVNHAQIIGLNEYAILSCRLSNSIVKLRIEDSSVVWVLGGAEGQFSLIDMDGTIYDPGTSLFYGQHNVEYVGNSTYFLFDNMYAQQEASRLLALHVDEEAKTATVTWEHVFGVGAGDWEAGYSEVFGDHDRLPTGNHHANWWPGNSSGVNNHVRSQIIELTTETQDVALQIDIRDNETITDMTSEWKIYSSERIYGQPLLYDATCDAGIDADADVALVATTVNTYKESHSRNGTLELLDAAGNVAAQRVISWDAFWRPTTLRATFDSADAATASTFRVVNQHGQLSRELLLAC